MARSALGLTSRATPQHANATTSPTTPASAATTTAFATSTAVRRGTAWNVALIVPNRYSVVIARAAMTMMTIRPKLWASCVVLTDNGSAEPVLATSAMVKPTVRPTASTMHHHGERV